ncbi:unnamed protein product, partial [Mycena citricolor]
KAMLHLPVSFPWPRSRGSDRQLRMPFIEPTTARSCAHTFCRDCIVEAMAHAQQCPVDRSPLSEEQLEPANGIIRSLVDELIVECVHSSSGCRYTCQRHLLTAHILDACPFSTVSCPLGECDQNMLRKDTGAHQCHTGLDPSASDAVQTEDGSLKEDRTEVEGTPALCDFCEMTVAPSGLVAHQSACSAAPVQCIHAVHGCGWTGPRADLDPEHLPCCPYHALRSFFALNNTRFDRIAEENLILRHKVESLERFAQTMNRELLAVKSALGPWFRPEGVRVYPTSDSLATPVSPTQPPPNAQDLFAAYFPAEESDQPPSPTSAGAIFDMGMQPRQSSAGPFNARHAAAIAPLNLSSTLEGTFTSLRESVIGLASAVDSLGRRNDIALGNETLRLNEEVMSLRATMHGLRMQVHNIMMDRNAQVTGRSADSVALADGAWPGRFLHGQSITKL